MPSDHSTHLFRTTAVVALLAWVSASHAASAAGGQPLILDTQRGIIDGQGGTVLQTAPLSHARIVEAQPIATPEELAPNSSPPLIVAPYIQVPGGQQPYPAPQPHPHPAPRPQ